MCGTLCRDFLHFCMGESTQNRLTSTGRNPYNGNRNHVGQWNRSNFGRNNTEAFEFLLSWKDDVLMNCLSGRRDKAFDPQAMQKVRATCAVLAEDGTYPFDLSVTDPEIYRQVSAWFTDLLRKS